MAERFEETRFSEHLYVDDHTTWVGLSDVMQNGEDQLEIIIDFEPKQLSIVLDAAAVRRLRLALVHYEKFVKEE